MPPEEVATGNAPEIRTETGTIKDQATTTVAGATTETPTTAAASAETALLNKEEPKPEAVPDKYEPFKLPEGVSLDEKTMGEAQTMFKELGLTQGHAQQLVDFYTKQIAATAQAPVEAYRQMRDGWREAVAKDPEIGSKLPQVRESIARALDTIPDKALVNEFREAMNLTGAGDNPAFIKVFYNLALKIGEGQPVAGKGPSAHGQAAPGAGPKSVAQALYPNLG